MPAIVLVCITLRGTEGMKKRTWVSLGGMTGLTLYLIIGTANAAQAMHITEGFLPLPWVIFWYLVALPFWMMGLRQLTQITQANPELKLLLAVAGAFTFVLSALKIPSVTGSSSHPTGTALGAILFGPWVMTILGTLVLLFQALLLAHGGLTTLGANAVAMAIAGPGLAWGCYQGLWRLGNRKLAIFGAAVCGNLGTYLVTALQLALAFPDADGGIMMAFLKFAGIFSFTQIPLAIAEGLLTVLVWDWLQDYAQEELLLLQELRG